MACTLIRMMCNPLLASSACSLTACTIPRAVGIDTASRACGGLHVTAKTWRKRATSCGAWESYSTASSCLCLAELQPQ
eukprot:1936947-Amphidinium_carterae.1